MIAAIVLAAGQSTRLGTAKQLLNYQGRPLIRHVVENIIKSQVQEIIVVVGSRSQEVSDVLKDLEVRIVINEEYADGQSTSVKKGVFALTKGNLAEEPLPEGLLFALGDQPLLKTETINVLIKEFNIHRGIIVPYYKGERGNPVIFERQFLPDLFLLSGDEGARRVIKRYPDKVYQVEVKDQGVTFDVDTWEDFFQLELRE